MKRRLLDLFCCAGGTSMGYHRAGWAVYGIELDETTNSKGVVVRTHHLKRYPFPSYRGDAIVAMKRLLLGEKIPFTHKDGKVEWLGLDDFDAVVASPPCQVYSVTRHSHNVQHPDLLGPTRDALVATGKPYIIENVVGAPLRNPLMLCGSYFDLTAVDDDGTVLRLERHRLFESNLFLYGPGGHCYHDKEIQVGGAYGGGSVDRSHARHVRRGGYTPSARIRAKLLGIDWPMTMHELNQSIPPAYTEFLGAQMLEQLTEVAA